MLLQHDLSYLVYFPQEAQCNNLGVMTRGIADHMMLCPLLCRSETMKSWFSAWLPFIWNKLPADTRHINPGQGFNPSASFHNAIKNLYHGE